VAAGKVTARRRRRQRAVRRGAGAHPSSVVVGITSCQQMGEAEALALFPTL
jgi:hypothetical protein